MSACSFVLLLLLLAHLTCLNSPQAVRVIKDIFQYHVDFLVETCKHLPIDIKV